MNFRRLSFAIVIFLIPLGMVCAEVAKAFVEGPLGPFYILLHPAMLLLALTTVAWVVGRKLSPVPTALWGAVALIALGYVLSAALGGAGLDYTLRAIALGVVPLLLVALQMQSPGDLAINGGALTAGLFAWAIAVLGFYAHYALGMIAQLPYLADLPLNEFILTLRSPGQEATSRYPFFYRLGNVNKMANVAVLGTIAAFAVCQLSRRGTWWFAIFGLVMVAILIVTFSRGAILVAALCSVIAFAIALFRPDVEKKRNYLLFSALMIVPAVLLVFNRLLLAYLLNSQTMYERVEQWANVANEPSSCLSGFWRCNDIGLLLFGYGPGRYGEIVFGTPNGRTHNLLLDIWTDGGVLAAMAFLALLVLSLIVGLARLRRQWNHQVFAGLLGIIAVAALGLREFELAYLNTDAIGAVMLGWFIALAIGQGPVGLENPPRVAEEY